MRKDWQRGLKTIDAPTERRLLDIKIRFIDGRASDSMQSVKSRDYSG
jgi:hypothetical protein